MQCPKCGGGNVRVDRLRLVDETSVEALAHCQSCNYYETVTATFEFEDEDDEDHSPERLAWPR